MFGSTCLKKIVSADKDNIDPFVIASGESFFSKKITKQNKTREYTMRDDDFNYTNIVTS